MTCFNICTIFPQKKSFYLNTEALNSI